MSRKIFKAKLEMAAAPVSPVLDTRTLFDAAFRESNLSPIDDFLGRLSIVNRLAPQPAAFDPVQAQLVLLGVIAAVESYMRAALRRVISFDVTARNCVLRSDVSFGAALHLTKELLPEAILERLSFVSRRSIVDALRDLVGFKGEAPPDLATAIEAYVKVCQLRHCAVHRFGRLGANNAIELGLEDHGSLLEKPLVLDYASLQDSILISANLVKVINNHMFSELVSRIDWRWDYSIDKDVFTKYHALFSIKKNGPRSLAPKVVYEGMEKQYKSFAARR